MKDLRFDNRFVRELPGDPEQGRHVRQVHGACYSRVEPTPVRAPRLLACSREVADLVLCARDRHAAVRAAYAQDPIHSGPKCDTSGLDENEAFARAHGLSGTPVIVRADGAVIEGFRPKPVLEQWLKGAKS